MLFNRINEELGYLLKEIQQDLRKKMDKSLTDLTLTTPQYAVLSQLKEYPGMSNAELARKSFVTPQTMNLIVKNLEDRRFIVRTVSKSHGRIMNTRVTETGLKLLDEAHDLVFRVEEQIFACLSEEESSRLKTILKKIRKINL